MWIILSLNNFRFCLDKHILFYIILNFWLPRNIPSYWAHKIHFNSFFPHPSFPSSSRSLIHTISFVFSVQFLVSLPEDRTSISDLSYNYFWFNLPPYTPFCLTIAFTPVLKCWLIINSKTLGIPFMTFHTLIASCFPELRFYSFHQRLPTHITVSAGMIFGDIKVYFSPLKTLKSVWFIFSLPTPPPWIAPSMFIPIQLYSSCKILLISIIQILSPLNS